MRIWDRAVALLLLAFAIYVIAAARDMEYFRGRIPGPGFAPFWIGAGLALAAAAVLLGTLRNGRAEEQPMDGGEAGGVGTAPEEGTARPLHPVTPLLLAVIIPGAVLLANPLGMLTALGIMLLAVARVLGAPWRSALLVALALPAAFHLVFAVWFQVPLPRGPWGF
jgi:hypothetical protein